MVEGCPTGILSFDDNMQQYDMGTGLFHVNGTVQWQGEGYHRKAQLVLVFPKQTEMARCL